MKGDENESNDDSYCSSCAHGVARPPAKPARPGDGAAVNLDDDPAADKVGGQCRQPIIAALRPAVFDRMIPVVEAAQRSRSGKLL